MPRPHLSYTNPRCIVAETDALPAVPRPRTPDDLTRRQKQVVALYATGASIKQIARELGVSYQTVKMHLKRATLAAELDANSELSAWFLGYAPFSEIKDAGVPVPAWTMQDAPHETAP